MSKEYIPTTERVRYGYSHDRSTIDPNVLAAEFDRWLESVKEKYYNRGVRDGSRAE